MRQICFFGEVVMMMVCLIMPSYAQTVNEGKEKRSDYTRTKELNELVSQLTKEGWKVHGSTRTLRGALQHHYDRMLENPDLIERVGIADNCKSPTVCRLAALTSASMDYSMSTIDEVYATFRREAAINESGEEENDQLKASFAGEMAGRIRGLMEESFALIRKKGSKNEYKIYFLLDRKAEKEAQIEARNKVIEKMNGMSGRVGSGQEAGERADEKK